MKCSQHPNGCDVSLKPREEIRITSYLHQNTSTWDNSKCSLLLPNRVTLENCHCICHYAALTTIQDLHSFNRLLDKFEVSTNYPISCINDVVYLGVAHVTATPALLMYTLTLETHQDVPANCYTYG